MTKETFERYKIAIENFIKAGEKLADIWESHSTGAMILDNVLYPTDEDFSSIMVKFDRWAKKSIEKLTEELEKSIVRLKSGAAIETDPPFRIFPICTDNSIGYDEGVAWSDMDICSFNDFEYEDQLTIINIVNNKAKSRY